MGNPSTPQALFGKILDTVTGQALMAYGYTLQVNPTHQSRGLYRYKKTLENGFSAYIEYQLLYYQTGGLSRFRVNLLRSQGIDARSEAGSRVEISLSKLLWDDFGVRQLDGPDHWWLFRDPNELGHAIFESGKLVIGFGIPWLEGTLPANPNESNSLN